MENEKITQEILFELARKAVIKEGVFCDKGDRRFEVLVDDLVYMSKYYIGHDIDWSKYIFNNDMKNNIERIKSEFKEGYSAFNNYENREINELYEIEKSTYRYQSLVMQARSVGMDDEHFL